MSEIFSNQIVLVAVGAAIGVILTVVSAVIVARTAQAKNRLFRETQGYPGESIFEPAIRPYVEALWPFAVKTVAAVFKASQRAREDLATELTDFDKVALAKRLYQMLPDTIMVGGKSVPIFLVKSLISEDQWAILVQSAFDSMLTWYRQNSDTIDRWVEDMIPADAQEERVVDGRHL